MKTDNQANNHAPDLVRCLGLLSEVCNTVAKHRDNNDEYGSCINKAFENTYEYLTNSAESISEIIGYAMVKKLYYDKV